MKYGWVFCAALLCGCSNLKTAGLRDARVLDRGKWEFTQEAAFRASTTRSDERALATVSFPDVAPHNGWYVTRSLF